MWPFTSSLLEPKTWWLRRVMSGERRPKAEQKTQRTSAACELCLFTTYFPTKTLVGFRVLHGSNNWCLLREREGDIYIYKYRPIKKKYIYIYYIHTYMYIYIYNYIHMLMLIVDAVALDAGRRGSGSSNPVPQSLSPLPSRRVKLKASEKKPFHQGRQECQQPRQ